MLSIVSVVLLMTAAFLWLTRNRYVVYAEDEIFYVRGEYETVAEVLEAAGLSVHSQDLVVPGVAQSIGPNQAIRVQRANVITLRTKGGTRQVRTLQENLAAFLAEAGITVRPSDRVIADGVRIHYDQLGISKVASTVEIGNFNTVVIRDGANSITLKTTAPTVGQALDEAGVIVYASDGVRPGLGSWVTGDMEVLVDRAQPYTIMVDGRLIETRSHNSTSLDVVAEAGIGLVGQDYVSPGPGVPLPPGASIRVVRVTVDYELEDEAIPFDTVWQATNELELDQRALISPGVQGILRRRIEIRYEDGAEVSRQRSGEWVAREPVNAVMGYGTNIVVRVVDTPQGAFEYWRVVRMRVTAYTAASSGKPPSHPAYGITASGLEAGTGVVAVDPRVVPFRTWVYVPGYGMGYAGDTGGGVKGRWIDLGYDEAEYRSWSGQVDVYYLTPVPPEDRINYLIPTTIP
jgi:resuscitation-promoting factor RpfB